MNMDIQSVDNSMMIIEGLDINKTRKQMQSIKQFQEIINQQLTPGHDYGQAFFGSKKPSLLKPGAEKILMLMGLSSEYVIIEKIQDYEEGFFAYTIKCLLKRGDQLITEGLGHCNSKERKYDGEKQDKYMLGNTCLKMAKKRAQVDATLTVGSLSGVFTQDAEDMIFESNEEIENMTLEDARNLVLDFGKYTGKKLGGICDQDKGYCEWIADNSFKANFKQAATLILSQEEKHNSQPIEKDKDYKVHQEDNNDEIEGNPDLPF